MYDTIGIRLIAENEISKYLSKVSERTDTLTGETFYTGQLDNFRAKHINGTLILNGSLPKYFLGNNLKTLSRQSTKEALEKLSDDLHLNINDADVYRIDISTNIEMSLPLENYYNCLGEISRYKKSILSNNETILYRNGLSELIFYDKQKELKKQKVQIPDSLINKPILRYESRYMKRLPYQFKQPEINLPMLYEKKFYSAIIEKWQNKYLSIPKRRNLIMKGDNMYNGQKELKNYLAAVGLKVLGGESNLIGQLNQKDIDKMKKLRLKRMIKEISTDEDLTEPNEAIKELDQKIKEAVRIYS